jgi:hypothetical protein
MVKLLSFGAIVLLGLFAIAEPPPEPCSSRDVASKEVGAKRKPTTRGEKQPASRPENPCDNNNSQPKSDATGETVGWDPVTVWDRPTIGEIVGWFLLGLLVSAPTFFIIKRMKSRKNELNHPKKILQ